AGLDQLLAQLLDAAEELLRDRLLVPAAALALGVVEDRDLLEHVDDPAELRALADRVLDGDRARAEALADAGDAHLEVGAGLVHLVEEADPRDLVAVRL